MLLTTENFKQHIENLFKNLQNFSDSDGVLIIFLVDKNGIPR